MKSTVGVAGAAIAASPLNFLDKYRRRHNQADLKDMYQHGDRSAQIKWARDFIKRCVQAVEFRRVEQALNSDDGSSLTRTNLNRMKWHTSWER